MKRLMAACLVLMASGSLARADESYFWVVGNHANGKCQIVTSNPIIDGDIWFGDGPYKSRSDAKLARSTIKECPTTNPEDEEKEAGDAKN